MPKRQQNKGFRPPSLRYDYRMPEHPNDPDEASDLHAVILMTDAELDAQEDADRDPWLPLMKEPLRLALAAISGAIAIWAVIVSGGAPGGGPWALAAWCALAAVLPLLSIIDLAIRRLPDAIVLPMLGVVAMLLVTDAAAGGIGWPDLLRGAICGIAAYAIFWLAWLRGIGGLGDAKLGCVIALALGVAGVLPALAGIILIPGLLAIIPLVAYVLRGGTGEQSVAFGPLLALGGLGAMVFNPSISALIL